MNLRNRTARRTALGAASILIVAVGATGCGGGDSKASDAPKGTSQSDFCGAFSTFETDLSKIDPTGEQSDVIKQFKSEADKLRDAGTPSNISDSARSGFEAVLDAIDKLSDDASLQDLSNLDSNLSATDKKNAEAFQTYLDKECPSLGGSSSSGSSSAG